MTLSRQIIIVTSALFIILFVGTLMLSINNMRDYLTQQLESHAQDAASSLGLSLTPHIKTNDLPIINSMVDAIFDRGFYLEINLIAINGTPIVKRKSDVKIENVPAWFIKAITLDTPQAVSTISSGWKQAARLHVRSHPGYAYLKLWQNTVETFGWFMLSFTVAIISFILALKYLLLPLKQIENMAISITRREFPILKHIPKTRELMSVVNAMNKLSTKIKGILHEQSNLIEETQKEAYADKLTGLANRRSFNIELEHVINSSEGFNSSLLLLVQIKDLIKINNEKGYQQGDAIIKHAADVITASLKQYPQAYAARIAGGQFGIIITNISLSSSKELAEKLAYQIPHFNVSQPQTDLCHLGGVCYQGKTDKKELLAKADLALQTSLNQTPNSSLIYGMEKEGTHTRYGAQLWAKMLKQGIEDHKFVFYKQVVASLSSNEKLHYEVHSKLLGDDGELISGMDFIPMAEKMGIMSKLDKHITASFIQLLKQKEPKDPTHYCLNISPSSFHDSEFVEWLYTQLESEPEIAKQLILETSEYVVNSEIEVFKKIVNDFQDLGCRFSLDHFGTAFTPFGYLHDLKIDFIKIHGRLVRGIAYNDDNRFFVQSLCQIAHSLDIQVIGEFVENEEDLIVLQLLKVDAAQGFYLGKVVKVD